MALTKLDFRPGVNKENTPYTNEGGWVNSDKIRFRSGRPEKMGGWEKYNSTQLIGVVRAMHNFRALDGTIYLAIATNEKVYVETGAVFYDITPLRETQALTNPFDTASGSAVITVNDTAHGADDGAWITISGSTDVGGIPAAEINAAHKITYVDGDTYTITVSTSATSTVSGGGGASVAVAYEINPGSVDGIYQYGWGAGVWGAGTWGTARSSGIPLEPRTWNFQNWGEDLIMNYTGGAVYIWDATNPQDRAVQITQAPHKVNHIIVTRDRHLVCLGCNVPGTASSATLLDGLQVRWCSQEDYTDWDVTATNTAGDQLLTNGTTISGAANVESQVIIWTDDDVQSMQYIGPPYTFGFNQIGTESGLASSKSWVAYNNIVYWMGDNAFYVYQGGTSVLPCTVQRYVFEEFNKQQQLKTFATLNREHHEISWYYPAESQGVRHLNGDLSLAATTIVLDTTAGFPQSGSVQIDAEVIDYTDKTDVSLLNCTRGARGTTITTHTDTSDVRNPDGDWSKEPYHYVTYNVVDQIWWVGKLERTAWVDKGSLKFPVASSVNGYLYNHEKGNEADGEPLFAFIESADFDVGDGDSVMFIHRVIPDFTVTGTVDMKFRTRNFPLSSQVTETIGTVTSTTSKIDTRIRARQMALVIQSTGNGWWKYGSARIDQRTDGRR